jgi:hypothetical protein
MPTMTNFFSDISEDPTFGGEQTADAQPKKAPPAAYVAAQQAGHFDKCGKCRGTGQTPWGACFRCQGRGGKTFKTSPEDRAKACVQKAASAATKGDQAWANFSAQQPVVAAWIEANKASFGFAAKMQETVIRFGDLTGGQLATCVRLADKDAARAAERVERIQNAPQVDTAGIDRLKLAFDKARAYAAAKAPGLAVRNPKITIGGMTISPAKATSANAGALYVKAGQTYLGKISNGKFFAARECDDARKTQVLKFVSDPAEAAKVYGQETGICCVCNATLKSKWRLRGIGPVCAEKMGWAGLAEAIGMEV